MQLHWVHLGAPQVAVAVAHLDPAVTKTSFQTTVLEGSRPAVLPTCKVSPDKVPDFCPFELEESPWVGQFHGLFLS